MLLHAQYSFHPLHRGLKVLLPTRYSFYPLQMERLFGLFTPKDTLRYQKLKEMSKYKHNLIKMNNGASCWVHVKPTGVCWSVHITDTELTEIDDEEPIWLCCKNQLEVLNLIRNKLETLPTSIKAYKDSLELLSLLQLLH